jgi:hypothetical protein
MKLGERLTFRMNTSTPFSESKIKASKKPKKQANLSKLHGVTYQKTV